MAATEQTTMAAVVQDRYGGCEVLTAARLPVPTPGKGRVLIRVKAVALNPADKFLMRGRPAALRLAYGLTRPRNPVRGQDVAGVVEAVGPDVDRFTVGDEVFGGTSAGLAELAVARTDHLMSLPRSIGFEQAAASVMTGLVALSALRTARAAAGQRILIIGASGGIGTMTVQLASARGLEVTGVCSARNVELVRSLGATRVIDYTGEDVLACGGGFDIIFDNVGSHRMTDLAKLLNERGTVLPNSGEPGPDGAALRRVVKAVVRGLFHRGRYRTFISKPNPDDLTALAARLADGTMTPIIESRYPLDAAADAMARMATGHVAGKVVVTVP